jgi:hypothetical protein
MNIQGQEMTFEQYCLNHEAHPHCAGCGQCLYDPRFAKIRPAWCVPCFERIDKSMAPRIPRPWEGDGIVLVDYDGRFDRGNLFEGFAAISRFGLQGRILL